MEKVGAAVGWLPRREAKDFFSHEDDEVLCVCCGTGVMAGYWSAALAAMAC